MSDNVLLKALPPAVDYLAYLTILEYNLTSDRLPVLHEILQDTTLTTNIGWDLVHLLLPLLPASKECLQDIARLGNPREVVLKTTELLEGLGLEDEEEDEEESQQSEADQAPEDAWNGKGTEEAEKSAQDATDTPISGQDAEGAHAHPEQGTKTENPTPPPSAQTHPAPWPTSSRRIQEFTTLLSMLSVLHPRIKTQYPSRFLSSTLRAILPAYTRLARSPAATSAVLQLLRVMSGMYRPSLPPRQSTGSLSRLPAPDPEAKKGEEVSGEETALQMRLLQSFLTRVLEDWMAGLGGDEVMGMGWASRYSEREGLERAVPGKKLCGERFEEEAELVLRKTTVDQIVGLARHVKIGPEELLAVIEAPESDSAPASPSSDLPSQASDVPLSQLGSLYLYSAFSFTNPPTNKIPTFPTHALLLSKYLSPSAPAPLPLIDTLLYLGLLSLSNTSSPPTDPQFHTHLHHLSLLSATLPSPPLRSLAHTLATRLLHAHPSPSMRLAFIHDTLLHCPFENLKACAVGWVKGELLAAASAAGGQRVDEAKTKEGEVAKGDEESIFATRACLDALGPVLFADPRDLWARDPASSSSMTTADKVTIWQANTAYFLAVLNLCYLLATSAVLRERYDIKGVEGRWGVCGGFVAGLSDGCGELRGDLRRGVKGVGEGKREESREREGQGDGDVDGDEGVEAMLGLLEGMVEMVTEGMKRAGIQEHDSDKGGQGLTQNEAVLRDEAVGGLTKD